MQAAAPAGISRRSEKELGDGEPLDTMHDSAAERTCPQRVSGERGRQGSSNGWLISWLEQTETEGREFRSLRFARNPKLWMHTKPRGNRSSRKRRRAHRRQSHQPLLGFTRSVLCIMLSAACPSNEVGHGLLGRNRCDCDDAAPAPLLHVRDRGTTNPLTRGCDQRDSIFSPRFMKQELQMVRRGRLSLAGVPAHH